MMLYDQIERLATEAKLKHPIRLSKMQQGRVPHKKLNDGQVVGQTVEHAHIHIIPRFDDEVADPRGGIRWVLSERAAYWDR